MSRWLQTFPSEHEYCLVKKDDFESINCVKTRELTTTLPVIINCSCSSSLCFLFFMLCPQFVFLMGHCRQFCTYFEYVFCYFSSCLSIQMTKFCIPINLVMLNLLVASEYSKTHVFGYFYLFAKFGP